MKSNKNRNELLDINTKEKKVIDAINTHSVESNNTLSLNHSLDTNKKESEVVSEVETKEKDTFTIQDLDILQTKAQVSSSLVKSMIESWIPKEYQHETIDTSSSKAPMYSNSRLQQKKVYNQIIGNKKTEETTKKEKRYINEDEDSKLSLKKKKIKVDAFSSYLNKKKK
ncbi:hypothetical protein HDV02_000163 [Globomyces sp. JEL0801]|nr:hypothetical protein HDV02_000163 [Globomyces sp. JEL0801]